MNEIDLMNSSYSYYLNYYQVLYNNIKHIYIMYNML